MNKLSKALLSLALILPLSTTFDALSIKVNPANLGSYRDAVSAAVHNIYLGEDTGDSVDYIKNLVTDYDLLDYEDPANDAYRDYLVNTIDEYIKSTYARKMKTDPVEANKIIRNLSEVRTFVKLHTVNLG